MLVQLNNGKIISLNAVTAIDPSETKIRYTLNNNTITTESFNTTEEVQARLTELFNFDWEFDENDYNNALGTAKLIQGQ